MEKFNPASVMFGSRFSVKLMANNLEVARHGRKSGRRIRSELPARAKAVSILDFLMRSAGSYVC